ncbi:hypothetical protein HYU95_04700 [Candidatus Daviesbacteria bacterium]|nr:hypothetical protein [Candidatus Daviesbacteria bacterium]
MRGTIYFSKINRGYRKNPSKTEVIKERIAEDMRHKILPDETEAQKEVSRQIVQDEKSRQKLYSLTSTSKTVLLKISTCFFLEFEPKDIVITLTNVTITTKPFLNIPLFGAKQIQGIVIENITSVEVEYIPLFATLRIVDSTGTYKIRFLKKEEAVHARNIIQGMLVGKKSGLDFIGIEPKELVAKLIRLGNHHPEVTS